MANNKVNMFGMPWVEWRNLAGLTDPYTALSAEQGVPPAGELTEGRKTSRSYSPKPGTAAHRRMTPKEKRLGLIVQRARHMRRARGPKDVLAMYAKAAEQPESVQDCRESLFHLLNAGYQSFCEDFVEAGGDSIGELHDHLDEAFEIVEDEIIEEVVDDILWEEFLVQKGVTLEQFHQLMDNALQTEDQDEIASLLALEDLFEAEKKKGLIGGEGSSSSSGGVTMKGFKSLVKRTEKPGITWGQGVKAAGRHRGSPTHEPTKSVAGGPVKPRDPKWRDPRFAPGGKYAPKAQASSVDYGDAVPTVEDIYEELLWEDFLAERGVTVEQFHLLMDEALESGDPEEMAPLVALDEIFGRKKPKLADPKLWAKAKELRDKYGMERTKKASQHGQQVGQEKLPSWRQGGGTSVAK